METIALASRIISGVILTLAAISKLVDFRWFVQTLGDFELAPRRLAKQAAITIIAAELLVGSMLIGGIAVPWSIYGALALFVFFLTAVTINFARGRLDINCGCFSLWKKTKIGWQLLMRNIGFTGLAWLSLPKANSEIHGFSVSILVLSVLALLIPFIM